MTGSTLEIDRVKVSLRVQGDPDRLDALARRVRDLASAGLQRALDRVDFGDTDDAYVFIERVAVECCANSASDDETIATRLAREVALAVRAEAARGSALRFHDRADFVAAYCAGRIDGIAHDRWWFDEFEGLAVLPASTAVRTLIINEGHNGLPALARLTDAALARVLSGLADGDGGRLLAWLAQRPSATRPPLALLWSQSAMLVSQTRPAAWLGALVEAERTAPGAASGPGLAALRACVRWRGRAASQAGWPRVDLAPITALRDTSQAGDHDMAWLEDADPVVVARIVAELAAQSTAPREPEPGRRISTIHGGAFLLLSRLVRLGWIDRWHAVAQGLMADGATGPAADVCARALAILVVAAAAGGAAAARVLADGALAAACEVDDAAQLVERLPGVGCSALAASDATPEPGATHRTPAGRKGAQQRALQTAIASHAQRLLDDFGRTLPGMAGSSADYLRREVLGLPATIDLAPGAPAQVRLGRAPLDVLLTLAGVKRARIALPGGLVLQLSEDQAA